MKWTAKRFKITNNSNTLHPFFQMSWILKQFYCIIEKFEKGFEKGFEKFTYWDLMLGILIHVAVVFRLGPDFLFRYILATHSPSQSAPAILKNRAPCFLKKQSAKNQGHCRDCFPKFANGLNIKIDIAQKVYELWNCSFAKMIVPSGENFGKTVS